MSEKPLSEKEHQALLHIRNRIVHGSGGTTIRELQEVLGYSSPNAAAYILTQLMRRGYLHRRMNGRLQLLRDVPGDLGHARTVDVPLVGSVPCGKPLLAEQNIEAVLPVSTRIARPPHKYFLLRADGDSMELAGIKDGDLALVRQQATADRGDRVVALIDEEATIKEFRPEQDVVILQPRSKNKDHRPIYLTEDFQIQGVVVGTLPDWRKG